MQVAKFNLSFAELTENRHASNDGRMGANQALELELLIENDAFH